MKLIKLKPDHYIIVDDSEIKDYDWSKFYYSDFSEMPTVITHSTQPLEPIMVPRTVLPLDLLEVRELIGEVDVEKKAFINFQENDDGFISYVDRTEGFISGYRQALVDNKNRKYTEDDLRKAISETRKGMLYNKKYEDEYIQSLQLKTEWEVEFIDGKLKLKQ